MSLELIFHEKEQRIKIIKNNHFVTHIITSINDTVPNLCWFIHLSTCINIYQYFSSHNIVTSIFYDRRVSDRDQNMNHQDGCATNAVGE